MISKDQIMGGLRTREVMAIFGFTLIACLAMALDHAAGIPIYIVSLLVVGFAVTFLKKDNVRIAGLLAIVVLSLCSVGFNGVKFGIDFSGGVRIPILLEKSVDSVTMDEMVNTIKTRAASFGLTEVQVSPIGDSEIYVELPQSNPQLVSDVEDVLSRQGVFQGIVDGRVAVKGEDIYTGTIASVPAQYLQGADWGVAFSVTQAGAQRFAATAKGKANYPLFMFLDRPSNAVVIITSDELMSSAKSMPVPVSKQHALEIAKSSLKLEGSDIPVYLEEDLQKNFSITPSDNRTRAFVTQGSPLISKLNASGFVVVEASAADMTPAYLLASDASSQDAVVTWNAVGLLSAPRLVAGVTSGIPNFNYQITGPAQGASQQEKVLDAQKRVRELASLLKGGALPVQITIGSKTIIPAPLGEEFLRLSLIGVAFALLVISLMVAIRYRHLQIILPMIFISLAEITILMAVVGSFTIDLSAMAGILAAIGVSVDAQIVVTDELLKKDEDARHRLEKAFNIITTSVLVGVIAMLPLLLISGLVEIIGFATSTILGSLLGLFISRPAYGAIIEHIFE